MRRGLLVGTLGALAFSMLPLTAAAPAAPEPSAPDDPIELVPFAEGLDFPMAFTFAPDGRVFYGELDSGQIRILSADATTDDLFATIPNLYNQKGGGLLGLALHPDYPATPYVYAYASRTIGGTPMNQVVRFTDNAGTGENMTLIFDGAIDVGVRHRGGRILFGPDDKLYVVQGETGIPKFAQKFNNTAGKILRMDDDGSVPADNPYFGSLFYAYGIRNSIGFDFDPMTGRLWETENGPACNDELNKILPGRNYGWGRHQTCNRPPKAPRNTNQDGQNPVMPQRFYTPTIAPTGIGFCDGCDLPGADDVAFMADWNTGSIRRITFNGTHTKVKSQAIVFSQSGGLASIEQGPAGALYVSDLDGIYRLATA